MSRSPHARVQPRTRKPSPAKVRSPAGKTNSRRDAEATRAAILAAAFEEFAAEGVGGARTDHIARAAGVNKALLYYYFKDKESLHGAVLEAVFARLFGHLQHALEAADTPRERITAFVTAYFDFLSSEPLYPRIIQREMMRAGRTPSPHMERVFGTYARPVHERLAAALLDGIRRGEIRDVDPLQAIPSLLGVVAFYFISAPGQRIITGRDPLSPERLALRRAAVLDFICHALFTGLRPGEKDASPADSRQRDQERNLGTQKRPGIHKRKRRT